MTHNNDNFEALPIEVINSTMTESQLKVMEVLFLYNGLDKTNENGHFYISNTDMMEKAGIGSKTTLNKVLSFFNNNRFIERKSGNIVNRQASEYILNVDEVINWSIEHPCKNASRRNTHNTDIMQIEKIVADAIAPILTQQHELMKLIERLREEIDELKSCLTSQSTCTPIVMKCTTDTDADTEYRNIKNSTDSTVIRQDVADTIISHPAEKTNQYDIKLQELKQAVDVFKRTPSWNGKKEIRNIIEQIKTIQQQGGCTIKQLNLAYAIQKDINDIPLPKRSSVTRTGTVPSTSVPSYNFSTLSPQSDTLPTAIKPTHEVIRGIEAVVNQANYFKKSNYEALIAMLQPLDDNTKEHYINQYMSDTHPEVNEEFIARKKEAYQLLNLQYPDYTSPNADYTTLHTPTADELNRSLRGTGISVFSL